MRSLIDYNKELFELSAEDLHQLFLKMHEDVPEAMDYQLRRRAILNGDEYDDLILIVYCTPIHLCLDLWMNLIPILFTICQSRD